MAEEPTPRKPAGEQNQQQPQGDKVRCFVSKQLVERSAAKRLRHPKEGLVWVDARFIH